MTERKGFLLVGVLFAFLLMLMIVPVMVKWVQQDTKMSVKDQKAGVAFSMAQASVDRGYWKVKSSTSTFNQIVLGTPPGGYNFNQTYSDVKGGQYRVRVTSGPGADQVTIRSEGRDALSKEVRAIEAVYTNVSVPGAILARGTLTADEGSVIHWGPVMSQGNVTVTGGATTNGYPRKLSMGTVLPFDTNGTNPPNTDSQEWWSNYNVPELPVFDFITMKASAAATGTLNCDDVTYTSTTYTAATNPCFGSGCSDPGADCACSGNGYVGPSCVDPGANCSCTKYTIGPACVDTGANCSCSGSGAGRECTGTGCTDSDGAGTNCNLTFFCSGNGCSDSDGGGSNCRAGKLCRGSGCADSGSNCDCNTVTQANSQNITEMQCCSSAYYGGPVTCQYGGSGCQNCTVADLYDKTALRDKDYTWFWENNGGIGTTSWTGRNGMKATVVVMGNLSIAGGDYYCSGCNVKVPPQAWKEYQKYDTSSSNDYPGDTGLRSNAATYTFGSNATTSCSGSPSRIVRGELWRMPCGTSGLGADLGLYGFLYVKGNLTRTGDSDIYGAMWVEGNVAGSGNTMVFYNSKLNVPTLNVVLVQDSWKEVAPSAGAW